MEIEQVKAWVVEQYVFRVVNTTTTQQTNTSKSRFFKSGQTLHERLNETYVRKAFHAARWYMISIIEKKNYLNVNIILFLEIINAG